MFNESIKLLKKSSINILCVVGNLQLYSVILDTTDILLSKKSKIYGDQNNDQILDYQ